MIGTLRLSLPVALGLVATAPAASPQATAPADRGFELSVMGPGGKPIPGAVVELRTDPKLTAGQVRRGRVVQKRSYRTPVATDGEGRLAVDLPRAATELDVFIEIPGYGPYWAGWSSGSGADAIPPRFTAELEPAWSVGGVVVDVDGKPVEGVQVGPSIEFRKRPGEMRQLGSGASAKTDAEGRWRFDSVPASMGEVFVEVNHPQSRPLRRTLTRAEFSIEPGRGPSARIVLDRGLTVTGKVTDESGKPIAGALVKAKFLNDLRQARTGPDSVYRLTGCEPRQVRIVASARGRATDMKEVRIEPGMGPVDFAMKSGGIVRLRVLDARGNPIPKTRIFFQRWRGHVEYFEFDHVGQYADEQGRWVWNEAPVDEFRADICPPGGMQLLEYPLVARAEEYVIRLPEPLVVTGKVTDAATKQPIKSFRVIPGIRSSPTHMNWARGEGFPAADGHYEFRPNRGYPAHIVRIEADGYRPAASRDIKSDEGNVVVDFELEKGKDVTAKVVTPRNRPAAKARVALGGAGSQIQIKNGDIDDGSTFAARAETDDAGRFHFPAQDKGFQLVIVHPSGFAQIKSTADWELTRIIRLEPWCRVEGTYRIGRAPAANVPLEISVPRVNAFGDDGPHIYDQHLTTTGPDGRFAFDRVIPGLGRIGRCITFTDDEGASEVTSAPSIAARFPAGETVHIDLGGAGRPVVGKLRQPEGFTGRVRWNFAVIQVQPAGAKGDADGPSFTATVDRDGTFRIDDMPAGDYSLDVYFMENDPGHLRNHRFRVPAPEGDPAARPVDLGTLKLETN
jgi:uncharacterized GH25 family protein